MSLLPPPPPPPVPPPGPWASIPPPPPFEPPPSRARNAMTALGVVIAGLVVLGLVVGVTRLLGSDGPDHPDVWDPRVADLADFVERARDLDFDHPVYVDFLTADEYTELTTDDEADADATQREELDRYAAELRALGVASGELDLFTALNQVSDGGTLAFYDPDDARIRVRGTEMTVGLEVTLVHELTHALQDQHFDLSRTRTIDGDSGAATAFRGLAEGDALRVEDDYIADELTTAQQAEYDAEFAEELADSEVATAGVPAFVSATFAAPYALGQPFTTMLLNVDGNAEVDAAFSDPPTTEEHLFDPVSFLADEGEADDVDLGFDDEELFDEGSFGATSWYLVLAERIEPEVAFEATLGWGGDRFAAVERDGVTCVRAAFVGDTAEDEAQMAAALEAWLEAMPGGEARLLEVDGHPVLDACDPGEDLDLELTGRSENALYLPNLWGYLTADAASELDPDGARCYGRRALDGVSFEQITDPEGAAFAGSAFQDRLRKAYAACR